MKNVLFLALAFLVAACGGSPEGETVEAQEAVETAAPVAAATTMGVDTEASVINWVGAKIIGKQHTGTIKLSDGQLSVQDGKLVGGNFTIDMATMENTDLPDAATKAKLVGHLSAGDFFEVETYPKATFEITSVEEAKGMEGVSHKITGNLTMKDITKSVTIPAMVTMAGGTVQATTPQFTIDRTAWGVKYGSTAAGVLKDEAIDDMIGLSINLSAK